MSAASYVGRVGGLAVALGVGSAIFTGTAIAHAEGDDPGSGAPAGQEQGGTTTPATSGAEARDPGKIDFKLPRLTDVIGRHRADSSTPNSLTANSIVKRLSDAAKRVTDAIENATDADNTVVRSTAERTGRSSPPERLSARTETATQTTPPQNSVDGNAAETNTVVSNQFVNRAASLKDWIRSPLAVAGRSADTTPTTPATTQLWSPPQIFAPLGTMRATPGTASPVVRASSVLTTVLGSLNPFAGNTPGSPVAVDPLSLVLAGAARREIGIESFTPTALLAPNTNSLTYAPTPTFLHGVIGGTNTPTSGVTYLVVSQPSAGGKVYVDPTTGNYTFLPDLSTVTGNGAETFKVVAAETTPFTQALTGIPVVGDLVDEVLVVLYRVPVVNVLLSPIIGRSEITSVTVDLADVDGYTPGDPVAFTVMVPSDDGVMISTNYFPAWSVADGTATEAPTILNGPGLATAGNIDPNAPNTVDGLVPGIDALTEAGYNVVTWDPRGEFASTGRLELDSPMYEGQDVRNIISWVTDHPQFTYTAMEDESTDDPWIGMVGGSYGGGIQLVSAAVDKRIDVIVPGIAWNNLNDSLYPHDAFKTSYSALLLLGLVTTGSRINPQIYGGIITGAVLGILTPGQQQLLERSGPWYLTDAIDVPTMFIQGTVDVLFPLQQALNNAEGLGTAPDDVKMIWFCGGHGACLTLTPDQLAAQNAFLATNTIAFLNNVLPEADGDPDDEVTIPKFQFVDQNGTWYTADELPIDEAFYTGGTPIVTQGSGGLLGIIPLLGGSGPQSLAGFPASLGLGSEATNAVSVPLNDGPAGSVVVGAPQLTMTYSGLGTSRHVYAQVVDRNSGLVVGNIVTPLPVTLDGRTHTQTYSMEDIVWTYDDVPADADLELQIVTSATPYLNFTQYGYIDVKNVSVSLPTPGPGVVSELQPQPLATAV